MNHIEHLRTQGACADGLEFAAKYPTLRDAWDACTRVDWLRWIVRAPAAAEYERVRDAAAACTTCDELRAAFACPEVCGCPCYCRFR